VNVFLSFRRRLLLHRERGCVRLLCQQGLKISLGIVCQISEIVGPAVIFEVHQEGIFRTRRYQPSSAFPMVGYFAAVELMVHGLSDSCLKR
jgi:hypothetical protein